MAIWIQSLSWTLIYSLGQGILIYASLWVVLKAIPAASPGAKYHLSLSAFTGLIVWFAVTWWQQFHILAVTNEQTTVSGTWHIITLQQLRAMGPVRNYSSYQQVLSSVQMMFPWLSGFYLAGLMLMLVRLSAGMNQLFSLGRNGLSQTDTTLHELLASLKSRLHFNGHVQLFISAKAPVPMVVGFFKPMILMPAAAMAQLSMEQLETILLHELAHIKRYDHLVNMLQTVVETILFFNPFAWMISAIIRREREHCCDDLVLDHTREPLFYATALAALATYPGASSFTVAASGQPNYLFNRIKRIMEMKKNRFSYSRMAAAILIVVAIAGSAAWLTPAFAETKKARQANAVANRPAPVQKEVPMASDHGESQLIQQLLKDRMIDEIKGFTVEKQYNKLYIDGQLQAEAVASKYLQGITQEMIRVQVYSFRERLSQHPDAGIMQLIAPVSFSSPCVVQTPKKPGC